MAELNAVLSTQHKILVVEDEALVALSLSLMLEDMGHEVCGVAASVSETLDLAEACRPDLVLMDVNLGSGGDGVDAARALAESLAPPPRILFLTSYVDDATAERMRSVDPVGVLHKPYDENRLRRTVTSALAA